MSPPGRTSRSDLSIAANKSSDGESREGSLYFLQFKFSSPSRREIQARPSTSAHEAGRSLTALEIPPITGPCECFHRARAMSIFTQTSLLPAPAEL